MSKKLPPVTLLRPAAEAADRFVRRMTSDVDVSADVGVNANVSGGTDVNPHSGIGVNLPALAPTADVPTFQRAGRSAVVPTKEGTKRRTTVYFDLAAAKRLATYCSTSGRDMSGVVNEAVLQLLDRL